jgi:hypothetical protein
MRRRDARLSVPLVLLVAALVCGLTASAEEADDSAQKQANNPLADKKAFNVQNYYIPDIYGLPDEKANTAWLRYVQPAGNWLIRASLRLPTVPTPAGTESGVGDLNAFAAYILSEPGATRMTGVGPLLVAPTASEDVLGAEKWQAGAAFVVFDFASPTIQYGGLVTYQTSFAGESDRDTVATMIVQPLVFWQLGKGTYLRSAPAWVFDFENNTYNIPFALGVGKVVKSGGVVYNAFIEPQFTMLHKGDGQPAFQLFAGLNMQF